MDSQLQRGPARTVAQPVPKLPPRLAAELRRIAGHDAVLTDRGSLLVYESDGLTLLRRQPRAVVLPGSAAQVAAVVRTLSNAGVPFVARGAGTGLAGGALASAGAVVIGLARMDRILELDPASRRARAEAGVPNAALSDAAARYGLHYAPDPSSQTACTLGGNVAANAGGPHCLKYGVTSNHVTALTVVLPDGELLELRGSEADGADLVGLFVGSEGTFGIATEVEVILTPVPAAVETLLAIFDDIRQGSMAVSAIIAEGLLPAALEMIDGETILAVEQSIFAAGYPTDAAAALVIELDGCAAGLEREAERARELCLLHGAREVRRAGDEAERLRLWQGRKKAFGAMGRVAPDLVVQDAVVPRSRLPDALDRIRETAQRHRLRICNVFHAGDGNLHPNIPFDSRDPDQTNRVAAASRDIMLACLEMGGSLTGEHGVGLDKRQYMEAFFDDVTLGLMNAVRRAFDPEDLANPGKVLPQRIRQTTAPARPAASPAPRRYGENLAREIRKIIGDEAVRAGEPTRRWALHGRLPRAVAAPASAQEAAALLARASAESWSTEIAGSGASLPPCASRPIVIDLVITTERMTGMVEHEPADLTASASAGTPLAALQRSLRLRKQWLPLEPPAKPGNSVGGTIASAAAGPLRAGFGSPRDHVLGLQLVTGNGRIVEFGGRVVKNVAGYDLVKLVTGSLGSLGLITRATLRLRALPERDCTLLLTDRTAEPLLVAAETGGGGLEPVALELLSPRLVALCGGEPGEWGLLARFAGNADAVAATIELLRATAPWTELPDEGAESAWTRLAGAEVGANVLARLVAKRDDLRRTLGIAGRLASIEPRASIVAHATAGIVRVVLPVEPGPAALGSWTYSLAAARTELLAGDAAARLFLSRAPRKLLERLDPFGDAPPCGRLLEKVSQAFDPAGILAPGRRWQ